MKKQIIVLSCVAAVAIATFVGKKAYEFSYGESKTLFKLNIEALTQDEITPCIYNDECGGVCAYANVGHCKGRTYCVTHVCDSVDVRMEYSYESCYANGHGIMQGSNMTYNVLQEELIYTKCTGERGHVYFPDI